MWAMSNQQRKRTTVILAAGAGKVAARAMHRYMMGLPLVDPEPEEEKKKEPAAKK